MHSNEKWHNLGWRHPLWDLLRFYLSIRSQKLKEQFKRDLKTKNIISIDEEKKYPVSSELANQLLEYIVDRDTLSQYASSLLRTEKDALKFCEANKFSVKKTTTKNQEHHQSSKAMISAVSEIATKVCLTKSCELDANPSKRCVWFFNNTLHVSARNLDGAIPSLANPFIVWEIKEYWGKTKGGSKMSDAVYECHLVGLELRDYEERSNKKIIHVVFLDGKHQWQHRVSDLKRFIDLLNQGFIDYLIVGQEVEEEWEKFLLKTLD